MIGMMVRGDEVQILVQGDGNYRLDVRHDLRLVPVLPIIEVEVTLHRDTHHVCHRVLRSLGQILLALRGPKGSTDEHY